jgi:RNA recognition motif-containing protein
MIITDHFTKKSKGLAFLDFESEKSATNAIQQMNGKCLSRGGYQLLVQPYE